MNHTEFIGQIIPRILYYNTNKYYDGTNNVYLTFNNLVNNDDVIYNAVYSNNNVGNYLINVSISGSSASYYNLYTTTISSYILPKPLYIYGSKIYDGTSNIILTISGLVINQQLNYYAEFYDSNAELNKLINFTISGIIDYINMINIDLNNYIIPTQIYGNIYPIEITSEFIISDKIYDRNYNAKILYYTISGFINNDNDYITLSSNIYALYNNYNIGYDISVNIFNVYLYPNNTNYFISNIQIAYANIYSKNIYAIGLSKIYDSSSIAYLTLSGLIYPDIIDYIANFDNKNVGINKKITITSELYYNFLLQNNISYFYSFDYGDINNNRLLNHATNQYDATVYNNPIISNFNNGINDSSLYLNGNNQYIKLDSFNITNNGLTIATWFNVTSDGWARLFDFGNGPSNNNILYAPGNGCALYLGSGQINGQSYASGYANNQWYHFTWIINPDGNSIVYINGNIVYTGYHGYPNITNRLQSYIGKSNWDGDPYLVGYISNFMIFDSVLTQDDVNKLINYKLINYNILNKSNYNIMNNVTYANIYQREVDIIFNIPNKTYDLTNNINIQYTLSNIILLDNVYLNYEYIFDGIYVGTYLLDIYTININDNNYFITISSYIQEIIIYPFKLNILFYSLNKNYDATNIAYVNYEITNLYLNDINYVDICNYLAFYDNIGPGINIPIYISNIKLFGPLSNNYYTLSDYIINGNIYPTDINIKNNKDELMEYLLLEDEYKKNNNDNTTTYYYYVYDTNNY